MLAKDERGVREGDQGWLTLEVVDARLGRLCGRSGVKVHVVIRSSRVDSLKGGVTVVAQVERSFDGGLVLLLHCRWV
jgi:hypothetical protein